MFCCAEIIFSIKKFDCCVFWCFINGAIFSLLAGYSGEKKIVNAA